MLLTEPYRQEFEEGLGRYVSTGESPLINRRVLSLAIHQGGQKVPIEVCVTATRTANETSFCVMMFDSAPPIKSKE
jgi:hypothetical protein